jgi:hypothetical protein
MAEMRQKRMSARVSEHLGRRTIHLIVMEREGRRTY